MCWLKTSEIEMKIIKVVKCQGVNLYRDVLNILVFSSMVGYLNGGIHWDRGMSPSSWRQETLVIALIYDA